MSEAKKSTPEAEHRERRLMPAARRALAEAEARRAARGGPQAPAEVGGRKGPEPVRYGDWEVNGLATDF